MAMAWPKLIARRAGPRNRYTATGMVGAWGRATKAVAPNSPMLTEKAKTAATNRARPTRWAGRSAARSALSGEAPRTHGRLPAGTAGACSRKAGENAAHHERKSDQAVGQGDQGPANSRRFSGWLVQGNDVPEPQGHGRGGQGKHETAGRERPAEPAFGPGQPGGGQSALAGRASTVANKAKPRELNMACMGGTKKMDWARLKNSSR